MIPTLHKYRTPLIVTIAVVAAWYALGLHDTQKHDPIDTAIISFIAIGFSIATVTQIVNTTVWTIRSTGLVLVLSGDSLLYGASSIARISENPTPEVWTDLCRALFIIGMPMLIGGLVAYQLDRRERLNA